MKYCLMKGKSPQGGNFWDFWVIMEQGNATGWEMHHSVSGQIEFKWVLKLNYRKHQSLFEAMNHSFKEQGSFSAIPQRGADLLLFPEALCDRNERPEGGWRAQGGLSCVYVE